MELHDTAQLFHGKIPCSLKQPSNGNKSLFLRVRDFNLNVPKCQKTHPSKTKGLIASLCVGVLNSLTLRDFSVNLCSLSEHVKCFFLFFFFLLAFWSVCYSFFSSAQDAINRIQDLMADGTLTGDSQSSKGIFLELVKRWWCRKCLPCGRERIPVPFLF